MKKTLGGIVAAFALVVLGACQVADKTLAPTPGKVEFNPAKSCTLDTQTEWDALIAEALALYIDGSPSEQQAAAKIDNLIKQCSSGNYTTAEQKAWDLANYTLQKWSQGALAPGVTEEQVDNFIGALLAAAGVVAPNDGAWVVEPTDQTKTFYTPDFNAAITVSGTDVDATTVITYEELPFGQALQSYLTTNLDQFPRYYRFEKQSQDGSTTFNNPVIVALCVLMPTSLPSGESVDDVFARLALGHQHGTTFEVAPPATPQPNLDCNDTYTAPSSRLRSGTSAGTSSSRIRAGAGAIAPAIIDDSYGTLEERGGVGGLADNFSDFGVVDPYADARGGVGGLADNFRPGTRDVTLATRPAAQRLTSRGTDQVAANHTPGPNDPVCSTPISGLVGSSVAAECRPTVTVQTPTANTNLLNVPVTFTVTGGGGQIAIENTDHTCGTFGSSVTVPTAVYEPNGPTQARVCWTLGSSAGTNTVSATVAPGGDAADATGFIYEGSGDNTGTSIEFTAEAIKITPTAGATGGTFTYNGQAVTGSGTCTYNGNPVLTPVLSYDTQGGGAPVDAGTYTLTVTCGDGGTLYNTTTATATITIDPAPTTTTVSCPASVGYTGSAQTPCTASVTGNGLTSADAPTVTYNPASPTDVGTYSASATFTRANYVTSSDSKSFDITAAATTTTVSCPTSVTYNGAVQTPCTATVTGAGGLSQSATVSYNPASPKDAGSYSASASFAGSTNYSASQGSASFNITQRAATATAGSATMLFGSAVPQVGCTVTGLLAADAGTVTCSVTMPSSPTVGSYTLTPVVSPATPTNYSVTLATGTLTVTGYVQVDCFAAPVYSVMPPTKAAQRDGSNIPIKCTLKWPNGTNVTNATGDLEIWSSTTGGSPIAKLFTLAGAFTPASNGNYSYGLDTGLPGFVPGGAYYVKAVWNDGSTTTGYFRLK